MPLNTEYYQQRAKELESQQSNYQKVKWFKWKPGRNTIRLLPPYDPRYVEQNPNMTAPLPEGAKDVFHLEITKCFNIGPNSRVVTLDPKKPGPCEEYIDYLNTIGDAVSKAQADKMSPKRRGLCWIIDRDNEIEGVQCLDWPMTEFRNLINLVSDPEWSNLTDPFSGIDLMIDYTPQSKSATGFATWGAIMPKRNSTPLTTDGTFWHEWLKADHFAESSAGRPTDPEYIKACLAGTDKEFKNQTAATAAVGTAPSLPPGGALPTVTHPFGPQDKFWMSLNNQTLETTAEDIANHVLVGQDVTIMAHDQSKPWGPASNYGFQLVQPVVPVAPPVMPSQPSAMPVPQPSPVAVSVPAIPVAPAVSVTPVPPTQVSPVATPQLPAAPVPVSAPPPQQSSQAGPAQPPTQPPTAPPMPQEPSGSETHFEQPPATEAQQSQVGNDLRAALGGG